MHGSDHSPADGFHTDVAAGGGLAVRSTTVIVAVEHRDRHPSRRRSAGLWTAAAASDAFDHQPEALQCLERPVVAAFEMTDTDDP